MRKMFRIIFLSLCVIIAVSMIFIIGQYIKKPPVVRNDFGSLQQYLVRNLTAAEKQKRIGSAALVLLRGGEILGEYTFGVNGDMQEGKRPVPDSTLFLMSSVSKAVTTWGVMKLVSDGRIKLDEPVLPYLTRWKFPGSNQWKDSVTLRHLLSHTAGFVDGFGYSGFDLGEERQSPEESLNFPKDANMGTAHPAIIEYKPGTRMSYSSAGYTVIQILIEEVTKKTFHQYMREDIFAPLGINEAGYDAVEILATRQLKSFAPNFDLELTPHPHKKHTMMAGGSLRISAHEMALFLKGYFNSPLLNKASIEQMFKPQAGTSGTWGLGHELYGGNGQGGLIAGHGGGAFPRTGAAFRINPNTGNAIALMMTGGKEMIAPYMNAWTYWETGHYPFDIREVFHTWYIHILVLSGLGMIIIILAVMRRKHVKA